MSLKKLCGPKLRLFSKQSSLYCAASAMAASCVNCYVKDYTRWQREIFSAQFFVLQFQKILRNKKDWCSRWVDSCEKQKFSLEKEEQKGCFLLTHNLKNKEVSVRDKFLPDVQFAPPLWKIDPAFAGFHKPISVATIITKLSFAQRTYLKFTILVIVSCDTNFYGHFISYIEWTYRISHAFFWEWLLFVFSPPLGAPHRVSSEEQSRAPPTFSHPRHPRAPRLGSQIYSEDFFVSRDEAPYTRPVVRSPGRPLLQIQYKVFISDH